MKKTLIGMAFAAASLLAFSANAQQNCRAQNCDRQQCVTAQCDQKQCDKKQCDKKKCDKKKCDKKCDKKQCDRQRDCKQRPCMFEGLNLTESQKTQLKAISTPRETIKAGKKAGYDKEVNFRDYVKTVRADYLKQVKAVLTPEQYNQFLENFYLNAGANRPGFGKGHNGQKGHHGQKDCKFKGNKKCLSIDAGDPSKRIKGPSSEIKKN